MVSVYILSSIGFFEGDSYLINKPDNINQWPRWNEKFMDVLDGQICCVTKVYDESHGNQTECTVCVDFPEEAPGYRRMSCTLSPSWVSKVSGDDNELDEIKFDIKELF